ncbi:MAG: transaldolase [Nitrospirae bacterium]|nr:MAG: transaldolase [Nitrospirota bacterium]
METNPLVELQKFGQSFWYDNISRDIIHSGELERMIKEEGLRGVTSNPSIFQKAISSGNSYDKQLGELLKERSDISEKELFFELAIKDITDACDLLMPVYRETEGDDGYVSIEVDPNLAYDTAGTIEEATELFQRINRPNLMIKVPATREGLPAIEELIRRGVNVNVTLLFSVERYDEVIRAYLNGLNRRLKDGQDISTVASVASFFVSRVDTLTDRLLDEIAQNADDEATREKALSLKGKTAVANAQIAYDLFKKDFASETFFKLKTKGARIQRLLFGSTSTKNPAYSDILYVQELIGPGTINTMPDATWRAFKDHGRAERTIDRDPEGAKAVIRDVESLGISIREVTEELEREGVRLFQESFESIIELLKKRRSEFENQ